MPMMLDNNQFDKRSGNAVVSFSKPRNQLDPKFLGYVERGISRYLPDPQSGDTQRYKVVGYSGDHKTQLVLGRSFGKQKQFQQIASITQYIQSRAQQVEQLHILKELVIQTQISLLILRRRLAQNTE